MEFFDVIMPPGGETCFATMYPTGGLSHKFADINSDKVVRGKIFHADGASANLYFGVATFKEATRRTKTNVEHIRCFFIDLDAGEKKYKKHGDKVYKTRKEALEDFNDWLGFLQFPEPTYVVSSGEGWHIYWAIEESMRPIDWLPVAHAFRKLCTDNGLRVDAPVMIDYAHILRVPGSLHQGSQRRVEIFHSNDEHRIALDDFKRAIEQHVPIDYTVQDLESSDGLSLGVRPDFLIGKDTRSEWENYALKFEKDFSRCIGDSGCTQLQHCYENQNDVDEPLWRAALSVVNQCKDSQDWAIKISSQHDSYDEEATLKKLAGIGDKPYTCSTFDIYNPGGCEGCIHAGKVKSPVQIAIVPLTSDEPVVVEVKPKQEVMPSSGTKISDVADLSDLAMVTTTIPDFPFPFSRHKDGGLWVEQDGRHDEVYPHDVYVVDRMYDEKQHGEVLMVRFHTPNDGLRTFTIPTEALINNGNEALKILAKHGIVLNQEKGKQIVSFLRLSSQQMLSEASAQKRHDNFGWTDNRGSFVLGGIEFYPGSTARPVIPTERLEGWTKTLTPPPKANWRKWAELISMYNREGMEAAQFTLAASLGSPLYALHNINGGIIHLYSSQSGTGKTTTTQLALSIWGLPRNAESITGLTSISRDTPVSTFIKASTLKSVPLCIDEITLRPVMELRDMVYAFTQGRDKDRGDPNTNSIRHNSSSWEMSALTTGNNSLYDSLGQSGDMSEALLARILEIPVTAQMSLRPYYDPEYIKSCVDDACLKHYGIVGQRFTRYLIDNIEEVQAKLRAVHKELNERFVFTQVERYWEGMLTCVITAMDLGRELEFWDFDTDAVLTWLEETVLTVSRKESKQVATTPAELIAMFLNEKVDERLVVDKAGDGSDKAYARRTPNRIISVREELHTGVMYIRNGALQDWCTEKHRSYTELKNMLIAIGGKETRINLAKDTVFAGGEDSTLSKSDLRQRVFRITYGALGVSQKVLTEDLVNE